MTKKQSDNELHRIGELRNQSFQDAYEVHDVGEALLTDRLNEFGLTVFKHGDDKRDKDVHRGTGVDFGVEHDGETIGWVEVKCKKTSKEWLGRCNLSHLQEYRGFATYQNEPVFIFFCFVEDVDTAEVSEQYFVRVPPMDEDAHSEVLPFESKGHKLIEFPDEYNRGWPHVVGAFFDEVHP